MKKLVLIIGLFVFLLTAMIQAQTTDRTSEKEAKRAVKEARKEKEKEQEAIAYKQAVQAINNQSFVLEADRVIFKRGRSTFVTANTNFVALNDDNAIIQVAFSSPYSGPNGIGGITVEGRASNIKMDTDKRGNVNFSMNVMGIGVSAQVSIRLSSDSNRASVSINPNFNSNRITLEGKLYPTNQSNVFKGRSL